MQQPRTQTPATAPNLIVPIVADDTEEAPWMVVPEFQWRVVALLMSVLRLYVRRTRLHWHLAAELKISVPGADKDKVQAAAEEAHTVCPYSKATKGNIPVKLTVI